MMEDRPRFDVMEIPDGKSGRWEIDTLDLTENDVFITNLRAMFKPGGRTIKPGRYKRLRRDGFVIMSNTPAEMRDFAHLRRMGQGNVLINGLGLGCVVAMFLNLEAVEKLTVIEAASDVISLVAPYFQVDKRFTVIHDDAFKYKPPKGVRYDLVWHDIWDAICPDNLLEMARLHRKYGRRADYQGSWGKGLCKRFH